MTYIYRCSEHLFTRTPNIEMKVEILLSNKTFVCGICGNLATHLIYFNEVTLPLIREVKP